MRFAENYTPTHSIQSWSKDGIVIDDKRITGSVLVSANVVQTWSVTRAVDLAAEQLDEIVALHPEIVIVGTGMALQFPDAQFTVGLQRRGVGVEVMTNAAACRTFNVLLSEDRQVVLALINEASIDNL